MRLLYLTAEQWPTFRADIVVLFGKYLPQFGVYSDLVTEASLTEPQKTWPAGKAITCSVPTQRARQYLFKCLHQAKALLCSDYTHYDAVQVRDMTVVALLAIMMAKCKKKPFFYWLSYPQSEGQIQRAQARGPCAGMKYWFPLIQGVTGKWLLYNMILPYADHIFVQSENMKAVLMLRNIPAARMTPVPMGVDVEALVPAPVPYALPQFKGKRLLIYLGTLDKVRQIEQLFAMLQLIKAEVPEVMLILAGDTEDESHRTWLKQQAMAYGVADQIHWTGWLPMSEAWRYVVSAEVGLSPFPRGYLLDMASPTKAVEYMALGLPVVANDNPDQAQVIAESGAGLCVPMTPEAFATAVLTLLNSPELCANMRAAGRAYISHHRGYSKLAESLAQQFKALVKNN